MQNFRKIFYFHSDKRNKRLLRRCLVIFFCLFLNSNSAFAQSTTAAKNGFALLKGKVLDQQTQKPISKASVYAVSGKLKQSTLTNSKGAYSLQLKINSTKQPANYKVSSSKTGYITQTKQIWVRSGKTYTLDFKLIPANQPPQITSITPPNNSEFLSGASVLITVIASDPEGDALQYQFSIAGQIKQPWSANNAYNWQTSEADTGLNEIICEVKDSQGAITSQNLSYSIINPAAEEVLQKVADNYALIYDFKADMTLTSTLNGEPFSNAEYCKYYFKAPNKEKTEAYSDLSRTVMTEVNIIDGSNMYLIDPVNKLTQAVDLLTEANISGSQYSQMDLYYNQANFLSNHTVTKNNTNSDFNNFIVALDAIPKEPNNLYAKLELYIDYGKGLLNKISSQKNDELPQILEAIETKQMPNGAWLVSKVKKNPNLTAGDLIVVMRYDNIQINIGLTDIDFDPYKQY